jgi:hypothetical protein
MDASGCRSVSATQFSDVQVPAQAPAEPTVQAALERHRRLAAGMDALSETFLKAREIIQKTLENDTEKQSRDALGINAWLLSTGPGASEPDTLRVSATPIEVVPVATSTTESEEFGSEIAKADTSDEPARGASCLERTSASVIPVCSAELTLNLVLRALETHEKPPLSFALGILGWDQERVPNIQENPVELVDSHLVEEGRQYFATLVIELMRQALSEANQPGPSAAAASLHHICFQLNLPLGSLRFARWESLDWEKICQIMPLDKHLRIRMLRDEIDDRERDVGSAQTPTRTDQTSAAHPKSELNGTVLEGSLRLMSRSASHEEAASASEMPTSVVTKPLRSRKAERSGSSRKKETIMGTRRGASDVASSGAVEFASGSRRAAARTLRIAMSGSDDGTKSWRENAHMLLKELLHDPTWEPFWFPVSEEEAPAYYERIQRPMDLSTLQGRLSAGNYSQLGHFMDDASLIWVNAMKYNQTKSPIWIAARNLKKRFDVALAVMNQSLLPAQRQSGRRDESRKAPLQEAASPNPRPSARTNTPSPLKTTGQREKLVTKSSRPIRARNTSEKSGSQLSALPEPSSVSPSVVSKISTPARPAVAKRTTRTMSDATRSRSVRQKR